jgi:hypothetical protein
MNKIPDAMVELDEAFGGYLTDNFLKKMPRVPRDPSTVDRATGGFYWEAKDSMNWWVMRSLIQVPGFGRSMDALTFLDRSNLGPVEYMVEGARMVHPFTVGDTAEPRAGLGKPGEFNWMEFGGFMGIPGRPVAIQSHLGATQPLLYQHLYEGRSRAKAATPRYP